MCNAHCVFNFLATTLAKAKEICFFIFSVLLNCSSDQSGQSFADGQRASKAIPDALSIRSKSTLKDLAVFEIRTAGHLLIRRAMQ